MSAYFQKYPYSQNKVIVTCTLSYPSGVIQKVESKIKELSRNLFRRKQHLSRTFHTTNNKHSQFKKSKRDTTEDGEEGIYEGFYNFSKVCCPTDFAPNIST